MVGRELFSSGVLSLNSASDSSAVAVMPCQLFLTLCFCME